MKNVLLFVHQDPGQEARLRVALDLARALSAHLSCIDITPFPLVFDQGMAMAPAFLIDETEQEAANKARVQNSIEKEGVSWSWNDLRDDFIPCLVEAAANADIIVLNRKLDSSSRPNMRTITSTVVTHTDALVVAVDEHCRPLATGMPALIAWDGSTEAWHALQRALPLLKLASHVTIFQVGTASEGRMAAQDAAKYLAEQGVAAQVELVPASNQIAADICKAADRLGAAYCVMGAFGHSRIREALLGGVTSDMLSEAPLPLVLAH